MATRTKKKRVVKRKRTPAQVRATKRLVAMNKRRAKTAPTPTRARNPIRYVIQAMNVKSGATGWFTGETIDDNISNARTYKAARGAVIVAKQLFKVLPNTWRLIVLHEHRPR